MAAEDNKNDLDLEVTAILDPDLKGGNLEDDDMDFNLDEILADDGDSGREEGLDAEDGDDGFDLGDDMDLDIESLLMDDEPGIGTDGQEPAKGLEVEEEFDFELEDIIETADKAAAPAEAKGSEGGDLDEPDLGLDMDEDEEAGPLEAVEQEPDKDLDFDEELKGLLAEEERETDEEGLQALEDGEDEDLDDLFSEDETELDLTETEEDTAAEISLDEDLDTLFEEEEPLADEGPGVEEEEGGPEPALELEPDPMAELEDEGIDLDFEEESAPAMAQEDGRMSDTPVLDQDRLEKQVRQAVIQTVEKTVREILPALLEKALDTQIARLIEALDDDDD